MTKLLNEMDNYINYAYPVHDTVLQHEANFVITVFSLSFKDINKFTNHTPQEMMCSSNFETIYRIKNNNNWELQINLNH